MGKRFVSILLVLVFIISLSGCTKDKKEVNAGTNTGKDAGVSNDESNKDNNADEKMGRYMEKDVELPKLAGNEQLMKIIQNAQKQFEVYTQDASKGMFYCYTQQEDNSWKQSEPGWLNGEALKKLQLQLTDLCLGEDGNYYACFQNYTDGYVSTIIKASNDGNEAEILDLSYLNKVVKTVNGTDYYPMIQRFSVLKSGDIAINDTWTQDKLILLSPVGEKIDSIDIGDNQNFLADDNGIIVSNKDGKIITYNTETKNIDRTLVYEGKSTTKAYTLKEDGTLFMGDSAGIHRIVSNGTLWETTVDGALNSMSMPSLYLTDLFVTEGEQQEEYYAIYSDYKAGYQIKHYVFDNKVPSVPEKELTVYSLKENKTIRQAISLFQAQNANVRINYVVAMGEEEGNVSDYIRALNTELLSGKGADILLLDGLPIDSYIEKGVLADISDIVGKMDKAGDLLKNISASYDKDGKTYRIPIRFGVPIILGNQEALDSSNNLADLVAHIKKTDMPYTGITTYADLLKDYLALHFNEICVDGKLEQERLKEFLEDMKVISEDCKAVEVLNQASGMQSSNSAGGIIFSSDDLFQNSIYSVGKYETGTSQLNNVIDTMISNQLRKDNKLEFNTIGQSFIPKGLVALNRASKETDIAKEFISFLFTTEVQDTNLYDGFPVNAASMKKWFEEENPDLMLALSNEDGDMVTATWPSKEDRDVYLEAIEKVNQPIEINQILYDMIIQSAVSFLSGGSDIDQVTSEIMSKVNTYLAE